MLFALNLFLRQLRRSRNLSQVHVAQKSGIGRVTLSRWESGKQQPRAVEMEAVLNALGVTEEEARHAAYLLNKGNGRSHEVAPENSAGRTLGLRPRPNGGSVLCALRLRVGLSQEDAALKVGVTVRTLRRWEKAEVWPSTEQLHTLCYVLKAQPEELVALTTGGAKLEMGEPHGAPTLEDLYESCQALHHYSGDLQIESLKELGFFALEAQAWPLAAHSASGRQILSRIYSCHANYYSTYERWGEGAFYANYALDLLSSVQLPDRGTVQAGIASARCATYKGKTPTPARGMEILRHWLEAARWPDFQSWILSDMAKYQALAGNDSQSLQLAKQARAVVAASDMVYDLYLRELDEASILVQMGEAAQALDIVERPRSNLQPEHTVQFRLLEAEAALKLRDTNRADICVHAALELIDKWVLTRFQARVQKIIEQI